MRSKELSVDLRDRIVSRHRSGEGYQNISAALKVPKNTVASIVNLKKFRTTNSLPKAGRPAKLSNWGRRALVREVNKNLPSRRTTISGALHQSGLYGRRKLLLSKKHMTAHLEFTKRPLKDSDHEKQDSLVKKIIKDKNYLSHCLFTPLSSRRRGQYRCIKAGTGRLKNSFYLKAIRQLNSHH
uniref:Sleeping Beauty transposase HTH domain-containing protein n=1 Tax=Oncorhynchus tshawytscha TaxID=74940 RepID=A0AAZ3R053_ONCTS